MEKEKIKRVKEKAKIFLKNNIKAFVKDIYKNYYFCEIKEIKKDWVILKDFKGNRNFENTRVFWIDIVKLVEYRGEWK